ncbi:MAG: single-stranded-DNA-specific exonuclease RecJ [Christensenellaceae bacterium]|jgi:single-stranded-DNA-specific exonuclease|nr:single-stranded-DNA-specific exonuclease RecJ [Christensenellaceae bacterium]
MHNISSVDDIKTMVKKTNLDPITCKLLYARGITDADSAMSFLYPSPAMLKSPFELTGMSNAVKIIKKSISEQEKIVIFGDYDCDGIGALAILYKTLIELNAHVTTFLPVRAEDGYGLNKDSIEKILAQDKPDLLITVDCGTNSVNEVNELQKRGIKVIVTDHHEMHDSRPNCVIINPKQDKTLDPLCGAGVAFKLAEALTSRSSAMKYIDICAISTIADVVPLIGENRIIARLGIEQLSKTTNPGLRLLIANIGKRPDELINSYDVAFKIAPRLNATGRLSSAQKSLKLLIETNEAELKTVVDIIEQENTTRQALCDDVELDVLNKLVQYDICNRCVIVLFDEKWEAGVIGIAAARIVRKFNRPVILLTREKGEYLKGSCRSIAGINMNDALLHCSKHLTSFGGHSAAAGLKLKESNLEKFINGINIYVSETTTFDVFVQKSSFDLDLRMDKITTKVLDEIALFEPFGQDNNRPMFADECASTQFSRIGDHDHIKRQISDSISCIAFNSFNLTPLLSSSAIKQIIYHPTVDEFRGNRKISCRIESIRTILFSPTNEELLLNYARCATLISLTTGKKPIASVSINKHSNTYGHLLIAFTKKTFEKLTLKYPNYLRRYGVLDSVNPLNCILFSPFNEDNFEHYVKIETYDAPLNYISALRMCFTAVIIGSEDIPDIALDEAMSRNDIGCLYKYLLNCINVNNELKQIPFMIERFIAEYKRYTFNTSMIMYYILLELGLFRIDNNRIILIDTKTSIDVSSIYKACRGVH